MSGATLLLALWIPDANPAALDPDEVANELVGVINERYAAHWLLSTVEVSPTPAPQWLTAGALARLYESANKGEDTNDHDDG